MKTKMRHGQDYWQGHLGLWGKSGQTQVEYCASAGLNIKTFQRWKSLLMDTHVRKGPVTPVVDKEKSLVPVRLASSDAANTSFDGVRDIRIRFDNRQWIVDVPSGVDSMHLTHVLRAVAGVSQ